jgi:hypothetical protein
MQFMAMFTFHPGKAETPAPADLREAEFEMSAACTWMAWSNRSGFAATEQAPV